MDIHQKLVKHVLDPIDLWRIGEAATGGFEREFHESQFWNKSQIEALQLDLLKKLVAKAYHHCPFYAKQFAQHGVHPNDIQSIQDIEKLPILEKAQIQRHRDEMVSDTENISNLQANKTGGSTGSPISFFVGLDRKCSRSAGERRHNRWAGWDVGDKVALVWGAAPDLPTKSVKAQLRNFFVDRRLVLDTSSLTDQKVRSFHANFETYKPKVVLAYAQSFVLVTRHLMAKGLRVTHRPKSIVTSAEVLSDADRKILEAYYGCKVYNRYGCREVSVIASECDQHDGMHVMSEGLYVEILNGDKPARPGEVGNVVITDLRNHVMPLIRYRIGDMSSITHATCRCGRSLPRLGSIQGRLTDFLVADDGSLVSGVFLATYLLADRPTLGQVQIVQNTQKQVRFLITGVGQSDIDLELDIAFLRDAVAQHLGEGTKFECEVVESIPNSASGKFTFCRSEIAPAVALSN